MRNEMSTTDTPTRTTDKRTAILETTLRLLSERGLHDTPMSLIVKESGVSTGNVYHYFASKDELIVELYREIKLQVLSALLASYNESSSYEERFKSLFKGIIRYYIDHPREINFLEQFENSPYTDVDRSFDYSAEIQSMVKYYQKGIQEGVLKDFPMEILMDMGMAPAVVLAKKHIRGAYELTDEIISTAADACWDMLKQ
jgi:AcrR family transcriptional regulator